VHTVLYTSNDVFVRFFVHFNATYISYVWFSPGTAKALIKWSGNQSSRASNVGNICTKNYQNLVIRLQVTIDNVGVLFWDTL